MHGKGIQKEMKRFGAFIVIGVPAWMLAGAQTLAVPMHMCSGLPTGRSEQMIMTSLCDVMRISHAIKGGNYRKEIMAKPRGCCYCHLGVSVQNTRVY